MADNNPYLDILRTDNAQAMRQSMQQAADLNPDTEAKLQGLARQYGVPVDAVRLEQPAMERRAKIDAIDYDRLARERPATSNLLADPRRAAIAHDDLENLEGAENALKSWQGPKPSFASVASGFAETLKFKPLVAGMRLWMNDLMFGAGSTPEDQVRRADLVRKAGQAQAQQDYTTPAFESSTAAGLYSGGVSILQNLPGLAASIATANPLPGLAMAGVNSAAPAYGKYAARGATLGESAGGALAEGAVEVATEALPMGFLVKNFGRVGAGQFIAGMLGREVPSEQVATLVQDLVDAAVANPDKTFQDYLDERPDAAYQTLIATLAQGGVMGAASKIAQVASGRAEQAQMAEEQAARIEQFNQFAAASKVLQRDPQTFETFIREAADGAPVQAVFIDAQALLQSGVAEQVAAASPIVAEQLEAAAATGGQIAIPVDEYAARIAPTEAAGALLDHLKTDPEGFSRAEAQTYLQEQGAELQAEVERVLADQEAADTFKAQADVVRSRILDQLNAAGRFTPQAHESYASLVGNFYAVQAAKLGTTPEALYERYPLTVTAQGFGGPQLEQGSNASPGYTPQNWDEWYELPRFQSDDESTVLFNHGHGGYIKEVEARPSGVFDGLFALTSPGMTERGPDVTAFRIPDDKMLSQRDLDYELDSDDVAAALIDVFPRKIEQGDDSFNEAWKAIVEDRSDFESLGLEDDGSIREDSFMDILGYSAEGAGEASWFAQKLRGRLAAKLGYQAVQMDDENGSSWYIVPGVKSIPLNEPSASAGSDAYNQGPRGKLPETISVDGVARPTTNSKGQPIHPDIEGVRNFWRWFSPSPGQLLDGFSVSEISGLKRDTKALADFIESQSGTSQSDRFTVIPSSVFAHVAGAVNNGKILDAVVRSLPVDVVNFLGGKKGSAKEVLHNAAMLEQVFSVDPASDVSLGVNPSGIAELLVRMVANAGAKISGVTSGALERNATVLADTNDPILGGHIRANPKRDLSIIAGFGDSRAVDDQGRPLVVYHGGENDVLDFSAGAKRGKEIGVAYFSDSFKVAESYAKTGVPPGFDGEKLDRDGAVTSAYLDIKNPIPASPEDFFDGNMDEALDFIRDDIDEVDVDALQSFIEDNDDESFWEKMLDIDYSTPEISQADDSLSDYPFLRYIAALMSSSHSSFFRNKMKGKYDGMIFDDAESGGTTYILFRPEQIKSATDNTGAFDPADPSILHQGPRGAFSPATWNIALLQNADLSTFLHETGHAFLEMQLDMAARLAAVEERTPGEQEIVADAEALLRWFGLRDLAEWQGLDFEEKRHHHEKFARGFEAYLFEGRAPSIELQGLFQRFRAWLVNIYRDLKALNVELTDEVRGVMDRMIATGEQIQLAEMGRSMMPLFASPEQAGMTPEEFAAYQALGIQATADAIENLQARGLRDLAWIRNARSRELTRLQKEADTQRAQIRMEVRREVMSQPVYRAWQFLTGKIGEDDKIMPPERFRSDPDIVDPGLDSLLVAIAKLGGLNRESAAELWGVKPEDKPQSGLFGKPVLRAERKGWTVDQMAEKLAELGYLAPDENGNTALRDFEEAFRAELGGSPVYSNQADYDLLRANDVRPGDQVANVGALTAGRLDVAGLADIAPPPEVIAAVKARRMTSPNGLHPDIVAELFGFASGDELVRTLASANPPKEEIDALTDQRMLERFGELATPDAIARAADAAIHNAARGRMLATEANALAQAAGQRKILTEAAREFAAKMIARLKVRDIRPSQYASAEARAGRAARKASAAGDLEVAAAEKRNELVNHHATRAAYDAQAEVRAILRNFSEFANRPDKRLGKAYDLDIANAARAILGEYGIAEKRAKRAGEYLKAVESYDPELYGVLKASLDAAEANAKPVQELTVEDVRGLRDEIDAMLHLARRSRQMEIDGDLIDRQEVEDTLFARLEEIGIPDTIPGEGQAVTPAEARRAKLRTFIASARRVESWAGAMDGGEGVGPFRRFVFSRIKDAADAYRADKAAYLRRFRALFDGIAPTLKPQLIAAPELGYTFGKDSGGSAMNEILHALLHTGNSSNKRKLLLGRQWAQELPDGTLDTSRWDAFVSRMVSEGKVTKAHMDFVQGVWDLLEETKAGAQRTHRDVFGYYFDEVTAEPVQTPWGEYRGGYVPAMADARVVQDANLRALAEEDNAAMAYAFPTTPKGFTKARVEYNRPLTLDLRTLAQHIDKVLLFTHMEMPVRDVQRVLSKKVGQALGRVDPEAIPAMIQPWLNRSARQQVETPIAGSAGLMRFFSVMRARAGAAAMFANVSNAVQQVTGFALAAVKVRPGLLLSAAADYLKAPRDMARTVAESSAYMASRMDNEVAVMTGEINDILLNPSLLEQGQNWTMRHAYFLQAAVDNVMRPIIWTAAYNQAVEAGETERDAVRLADAAIRETQGSSLPEDISRIEGGNAFVRLFTQFAGYFNMQANLLGSEFVKIAHDGGLRQNAGRGLFVLGLGFMAPAVVAEAIAQLFRGGPDDADKDGEYLDDWIAALFGWAPLRNVTAMVPVVGQGVNALVNAANSKPYDDRLATSPAVSMLESAARAPVSAYKAVAGEGSAQKAVRDVATLISMTVGLPANLAARPVGYLAGLSEGRIVPTGSMDAARGMITGAASPESKR